jgi:ribonuclease P protein component
VHAAAPAPAATEPDRAFTRVRRLRRPRDYAAVLAAGRGTSLRVAGTWLSVTAAWFPAERPGARVGITVSKRMARRSIDRALVKRIVRDAFRLSAATLERCAVSIGMRVDISVRLKRTVGTLGNPQRPSLAQWRRALRADMDQMLLAVAARLESVRHA